MKILVTGGMGFVGSHLIDALVKKGYEAISFDNLEYQVHAGKRPGYLNKHCRYIIGDVRFRNQLKKVIKGVDIVFHQAAMVGVGQSMYKISKYIHSNTLGTANLLDIIANEKHKIKKIIVASSMSIYGEGRYLCKKCGKVNPRLRTDIQLAKKDWNMYCPLCNRIVRPVATGEDKPLFCTSVYALSKKDQEELCLLVGKTYGIPTVALRYFNIYGPRQALSNPYTGVCAIMSSRIKNNHPPIIYEDGLQARDFIHVKDIVRANLLVMQNPKADFEVFNVGTGKPTSILEIAKMLIKLYNAHNLRPMIVNSYRKGDIRHCYADASKIRSLGFKTSINLEQGMRDLIEWAKGVKAKDRVKTADAWLLKKGLRIR